MELSQAVENTIGVNAIHMASLTNINTLKFLFTTKQLPTVEVVKELLNYVLKQTINVIEN